MSQQQTPSESGLTLPLALSRRGFLKRAGFVGGLALSGGALTSLLAACGGGSDKTPTTASGAAGTTSAGTSASGSGGATPSGGTSGSPATSAGTATTGSASTAPAGDVVRGGTLTWAYTTSPQKLDPIWSQALVDETVMVPMIEAPARANRDGSGVEPCLAQKWDVSADGLTYTLNLRPNVKFHDGSSMTAADVVASLQRNKAMGSYM
ncbi:MAG TPA: ABC transporter substrate-binding protein, partial [Nitrolancea sp.]|nr:ABC transporter substrate-binding protein [Nitrolancea sp.]